MVSEQTCTIDHKMDQSLWQTTESFDILHPSYMWLQTILPWEKHCENNADWDCLKTPILREILKIQNPLLEEHYAFLEVIHFVPNSWMCKNQTSVSHCSTESEIISLDGRWIEIRRDSSSRFVESDCFCPWKHAWFRLMKDRGGPVVTCWVTLIVFPQTSSLGIKKLCCMCLRTTKQWSRWSLREVVPQWDMFPGPTTWTQKSKSSTSTPKTNLLTS